MKKWLMVLCLLATVGFGDKYSGLINHDNLLGFVVNEHIDWTNATQNFKTTGIASFGNPLQSNKSTFEGTTFPVIEMTRYVSLGNGVNASFSLKCQTTADMVDGFGGGFGFRIRDTAGVDNIIAVIYGVRDGADNSGAIQFHTYENGDRTNKMSIRANGDVQIFNKLRIGDTTTPTEEFEVNGQMTLSGKSELTIDANAITPTKSFHTVDTEGDIASDELVTITFADDTDGTTLIIRPVNDAHTIVIKNGTGNIVCGKTGGDVTLDDETDTFMCIYDTDLNKWLEL